MAAACQGAGVRVLFAPPDLCTDNAAMIAFAAQLHLARGDSSPLTTEIDPNLALA
jgi:N6-L-threonylcarbamoyladenine synthase